MNYSGITSLYSGLTRSISTYPIARQYLHNFDLIAYHYKYVIFYITLNKCHD
jgi:hypothetical protein